MPHHYHYPSVASGRSPNSIDLEALVGNADAQLIYEGLYRLRELKVEALRVVRAEGLRPNGRDFEPGDFGIPQIDRLLARFDAAPACEPEVPQDPAAAGGAS